MSTVPDPKTKPAVKTATASSVNPPATAPRAKASETLKVAYTKTSESSGIEKVVIFGTDNDRSDFLRDHTDEWWRIADVAKAEILHAVKPNG